MVIILRPAMIPQQKHGTADQSAFVYCEILLLIELQALVAVDL